MNFAMWAKALQVIPRLSRDEWNGLDVVSKWLVATRSAVLIMTFISAAIAGLLAYRDGMFNSGLWLLVALGLVLAHATNNMLNDVIDHMKGVDSGNYYRAQYGPQPLEHGLMTARQVFVYIAVTGAMAALAGLYLVYVRGSLALLLMTLGAFFVLFYTFPLKYIGLGELAVILVWGPLMIGGGYYVITGQWSWAVALASLPYALGPTTVIFGKHIDKYADDKAKGIHTLPVIIGERNARYVALAVFALQYLLVAYLVLSGLFSPVLLIVFLAAPALMLAYRVYRQPKPTARPADYPAESWPLWFVAFAFLHSRRFGLLFLVGLILDIVVRAL